MRTKNFLDGLSKLNFVKHEDNALHTAEGFEISYKLRLMGISMPSSPIQFDLIIRKDNVHITTFSCVSSESVLEAVKWWENKELSMHLSKKHEEDKNKQELIKEFESIIN